MQRRGRRQAHVKLSRALFELRWRAVPYAVLRSELVLNLLWVVRAESSGDETRYPARDQPSRGAPSMACSGVAADTRTSGCRAPFLSAVGERYRTRSCAESRCSTCWGRCVSRVQVMKLDIQLGISTLVVPLAWHAAAWPKTSTRQAVARRSGGPLTHAVLCGAAAVFRPIR